MREVEEAGRSNGKNIKLSFQPSQSQDCNVNDLPVIFSLQSAVMKFKHECTTIADFIDRIEKAFKEYDSSKLGRITGLEYVIFREILENYGGNQLFVCPGIISRKVRICAYHVEEIHREVTVIF